MSAQNSRGKKTLQALFSSTREFGRKISTTGTESSCSGVGLGVEHGALNISDWSILSISMEVVSWTESREVFLPMSYAMKSAEKHLAPLLSDVSLWVLPPKTSSVPLSTTAEWRYRARPLSPRISLHTHTHTEEYSSARWDVSGKC